MCANKQLHLHVEDGHGGVILVETIQLPPDGLFAALMLARERLVAQPELHDDSERDNYLTLVSAGFAYEATRIFDHWVRGQGATSIYATSPSENLTSPQHTKSMLIRSTNALVISAIYCHYYFDFPLCRQVVGTQDICEALFRLCRHTSGGNVTLVMLISSVENNFMRTATIEGLNYANSLSGRDHHATQRETLGSHVHLFGHNLTPNERRRSFEIGQAAARELLHRALGFPLLPSVAAPTAATAAAAATASVDIPLSTSCAHVPGIPPSWLTRAAAASHAPAASSELHTTPATPLAAQSAAPSTVLALGAGAGVGASVGAVARSVASTAPSAPAATVAAPITASPTATVATSAGVPMAVAAPVGGADAATDARSDDGATAITAPTVAGPGVGGADAAGSADAADAAAAPAAATAAVDDETGEGQDDEDPLEAAVAAPTGVRFAAPSRLPEVSSLSSAPLGDHSVSALQRYWLQHKEEIMPSCPALWNWLEQLLPGHVVSQPTVKLLDNAHPLTAQVPFLLSIERLQTSARHLTAMLEITSGARVDQALMKFVNGVAAYVDKAVLFDQHPELRATWKNLGLLFIGYALIFCNIGEEYAGDSQRTRSPARARPGCVGAREPTSPQSVAIPADTHHRAPGYFDAQKLQYDLGAKSTVEMSTRGRPRDRMERMRSEPSHAPASGPAQPLESSKDSTICVDDVVLVKEGSDYRVGIVRGMAKQLYVDSGRANGWESYLSCEREQGVILLVQSLLNLASSSGPSALDMQFDVFSRGTADWVAFGSVMSRVALMQTPRPGVAGFRPLLGRSLLINKELCVSLAEAMIVAPPATPRAAQATRKSKATHKACGCQYTPPFQTLFIQAYDGIIVNRNPHWKPNATSHIKLTVNALKLFDTNHGLNLAANKPTHEEMMAQIANKMVHFLAPGLSPDDVDMTITQSNCNLCSKNPGPKLQLVFKNGKTPTPFEKYLPYGPAAPAAPAAMVSLPPAPTQLPTTAAPLVSKIPNSGAQTTPKPRATKRNAKEPRQGSKVKKSRKEKP